jgi:hypothetical protein
LIQCAISILDQRLSPYQRIDRRHPSRTPCTIRQTLAMVA